MISRTCTHKFSRRGCEGVRLNEPIGKIWRRIFRTQTSFGREFRSVSRDPVWKDMERRRPRSSRAALLRGLPSGNAITIE